MFVICDNVLEDYYISKLNFEFYTLCIGKEPFHTYYTKVMVFDIILCYSHLPFYHAFHFVKIMQCLPHFKASNFYVDWICSMESLVFYWWQAKSWFTSQSWYIVFLMSSNGQDLISMFLIWSTEFFCFILNFYCFNCYIFVIIVCL